MQNWHKWVLTITLSFVIGALNRFIEPNPTAIVIAQSGVTAMIPALVALNLTLQKG